MKSDQSWIWRRLGGMPVDSTEPRSFSPLSFRLCLFEGTEPDSEREESERATFGKAQILVGQFRHAGRIPW